MIIKTDQYKNGQTNKKKFDRNQTTFRILDKSHIALLLLYYIEGSNPVSDFFSLSNIAHYIIIMSIKNEIN